MKRLMVILLLTVYTCTQLGPSLWYYYKPLIGLMASARQRIRSMLHDEEDLVQMEADLQQFKKMRSGRHEILLNGLLHDIEKISVEGSCVKLVVRRDAAESLWLSFHESVSEWIKKSPKQNESSIPIAKWLLAIFCNPGGKMASWYQYAYHPDSFPQLLFIQLPLSPFVPGQGRPPDTSC